jgi:nitrate reductase NapD
LVVTLEGSSQRAILDNIEAINALSGVLSASLIYHQVEPLAQESEEIL